MFLIFHLCMYMYTLVPEQMCSFFQSLESQLSKLAGVLTADMEKAKQLLSSADEGIPIQIHQDLASTYLELEPNITAVSQMCAERSHSLIQAMETGKVSVHC